MLPRATIPRSLEVLLDEFQPCFTAPTLRTFTGLAVGLIAQTRRRTVCGMLLGAGLERCGCRELRPPSSGSARH